MKFFLCALSALVVGPVAAHEGHGDTVIHAIAHFFDGYGPIIWLAFAVIAMGLFRYFAHKDQQK
jgi:ABC-type proline/glycine betaine transport system permease subunit